MSFNFYLNMIQFLSIFQKLYKIIVFCLFKLGDRMRSMRTNGASKNRNYSDTNGTYFPLFSIWIIFGTYGMF